MTHSEIARVTLQLGGRKVTVNALAVPDDTLPGTALLGRDIPFLADLLKAAVDTQEHEVLAVQTCAQKKCESEEEEEDRQLSAESGATPITYDNLPDLHPPDGHSDNTTSEQMDPEEDSDTIDSSISHLHDDLFLPPRLPRPKQPPPALSQVPQDLLITLD